LLKKLPKRNCIRTNCGRKFQPKEKDEWVCGKCRKQYKRDQGRVVLMNKIKQEQTKGVTHYDS